MLDSCAYALISGQSGVGHNGGSMVAYEILKELTFGHRVAEEEVETLSSYFVKTDHWNKLYRGDIDVIYGTKGSGKSALYTLLISKSGELFDKSILLVPAENPRGAPAFRNLLPDPPVTEREFIGLWKLYFITLLHGLLVEYGVNNDSTKKLEAALQREGLVRGSLTLAGILSSVFDYVRRALRPQAVEGGVKLDPVTQMPNGFTGKIIFSEPISAKLDVELNSVDNLLGLVNDALTTSNLKAWVLLDRLDVAFSENVELEANALRALFRVYLDMLGFSNIKLKIFLRSDIWSRIADGGFREASHVTRHLTIDWNRNSLLNLIIRRVLNNAALRESFNVSEDLGSAVLAEQQALFDRIFPNQVDVGPNKPTTLDWVLSRTRDGTKSNAPRELIHLLNSLRDTQVKRFEVGSEPFPEDEQLFARPAFKEALPEVSQVRLEQTLFAEHPDLKAYLEKLRGEKTLHTLDTLAVVWNTSPGDTAQLAAKLVEIGFFEPRGTKQSPEFWVPFLYRDALDLIQGSASDS